MLSASETTRRQTVIPLFLAFLLAVNKVLQSCARNLRAPALTCAQHDKPIYEIACSGSFLSR